MKQKGFAMLKTSSISIIDFHLHFPVSHDVYLDGWEKRFVDRFGEAKLERINHNQQALSERWRDAYLIPCTEEDIPDIETQAKRWVDETNKYRIDKVVFLTGGGNDRLAKIVKLPRMSLLALHIMIHFPQVQQKNLNGQSSSWVYVVTKYLLPQ